MSFKVVACICNVAKCCYCGTAIFYG